MALRGGVRRVLKNDTKPPSPSVKGGNFMCGIVGYNGPLQAAPILLDGLSKLEYRGYDSAGLSVRNGEKAIRVMTGM